MSLSSVFSILSAKVINKVFFAGEAYNLENMATVHGAAFSGIEVAKKIISD